MVEIVNHPRRGRDSRRQFGQAVEGADSLS
jgi:hypothetical protein